MRSVAYLMVLILITGTLMLAACNGPRPLKKGESLICPSCGAKFTPEEALSHQAEK